jgi:hypothetical protein
MLLVALLLLPAAGCPFRAKKMQFMCELQTTLRELMRKNEEYRLQVWLLLLLLVLGVPWTVTSANPTMLASFPFMLAWPGCAVLKLDLLMTTACHFLTMHC